MRALGCLGWCLECRVGGQAVMQIDGLVARRHIDLERVYSLIHPFVFCPATSSSLTILSC